jgi:hypothetical protein
MVHADGVNLLGENLNTIKKSTKLLDASCLEVSAGKTWFEYW